MRTSEVILAEFDNPALEIPPVRGTAEVDDANQIDRGRLNMEVLLNIRDSCMGIPALLNSNSSKVVILQFLFTATDDLRAVYADGDGLIGSDFVDNFTITEPRILNYTA